MCQKSKPFFEGISLSVQQNSLILPLDDTLPAFMLFSKDSGP
jgi:hypothetical protein